MNVFFEKSYVLKWITTFCAIICFIGACCHSLHVVLYSLHFFLSFLVNMADASCLASTQYSSSYLCHFAFDGNMDSQWASRSEGNNGWITITLPGPLFIPCIIVYTRCFSTAVQTDNIQVEFDDGTVSDIVSVH